MLDHLARPTETRDNWSSHVLCVRKDMMTVVSGLALTVNENNRVCFYITLLPTLQKSVRVYKYIRYRGHSNEPKRNIIPSE